MENRMDLYKKTVDILYNAYFNDTLVHMNSCACAVGNIIAANTGRTFKENPLKSDLRKIIWSDDKIPRWTQVFVTIVIDHMHYSPRFVTQTTSETKYRQDMAAKAEIMSTGYTWQELARIEYAFETAPSSVSYNQDDDEWMFNGLVAVLDTLKEIHGIEDNQKEVVKFQQHHNFKTEKAVI